MFPDTVNIIQIAKLIAINMVCHKTNGGRTGLIVVSSSSKLLLEIKVALVGPDRMSKMEAEELLNRLRGSRSFTSSEEEFRAWVHSVREIKPL